MKKITLLIFTLLIISNSIFLQTSKDDKPAELFSSETFNGLNFRNIGPALTSGRISDIAVNPENPNEYFVAAASGGVWKTTNSGITFKPIFDDQGSYSIGCITIDPENPNVVWVGTGENNSQRSVSYGDGIYLSKDGGNTWKNMGLKKSEHIAKILIHPDNSDIIFVAAQGPLWAPGGDRGLYKTTDGGKTWEQILSISENTGVTDIAMDPRNPDVLYAASYQRRRHVWTLINGGPESTIYKSSDGGENWEKIEKGLPSEGKGRIGLAVSPVDPDVVYAIVEAADNKGGFFRSTNRGASWEKMNDYIASSPQYYHEIFADPKNADRVYSLDTYSRVTNDGGKTFERLGLKNRHVDDHALWIDPENNEHLLIGGDGGVYETYDGGETWDFKANLPVTQFYKMAIDNDKPFYNVYGGTQDNYTLGGPAQTLSEEGIVNSDWFTVKGGDGFQPAVDPENPDIVYAESQYGWIGRFDKKSGGIIGIKPFEEKDEDAYRWNWDSPFFISPHSNTRLYFASNKVFKSEDRGNSWTKISEDLSRQIDRNKLEVMGKVWSVDAVSKNASTSIYGNIVSLAESPLQEGLLYAGTDDGLIQVTENGGETWEKISNFGNVPEFSYVSDIFPSRNFKDRVYAAFDNHKKGDFKPYILRSDDKGNSWKSVASDLPDSGYVHVIVEDFEDPHLLFAGTEFGVFFTNDGGKKWIQLKGGLPTIAVMDLKLHKEEKDLVLATFGRGFYVLDDYTALRSVDKELLQKDNYIFPVSDALMYVQTNLGTGSQGASYFTSENPPYGAVFTYYLKDEIKKKKEQRREKEKELIENGGLIDYPAFDQLREEDLERDPYLLFTIEDADGNFIRQLNSSPKKGINRVNWDLKYPSLNPVTSVPDDPFKNNRSSFHALPGEYKVTMHKSVDGEITELYGPVSFSVKPLNNSTLPAENKAAAAAFHQRIKRIE